MKRFISHTILAVSLAVSPVSPALAKKKEQMTPMQLQAMQSKEFEADKVTVFNAVMTVVQDLGYTVQSADLGTGFITAASPTQNKTGFFEALGGVSSSGNTVMTAFVMQMPNGRTQVRLNFVNTKNSSSIYGQGSRNDKPILDPKVYQNAWDRIDEALFVMGALKDPSKPAPADGGAPQATVPAAPAAPPVASSTPPES